MLGKVLLSQLRDLIQEPIAYKSDKLYFPSSTSSKRVKYLWAGVTNQQILSTNSSLELQGHVWVSKMALKNSKLILGFTISHGQSSKQKR